MIPPKIIIAGDLARGSQVLGFAKDQLRILERSMSFQGLNEGSRTVKPFDDIVVEVWSSFSLQEITIHVLPPPGEPGEGQAEKDEPKVCPCECNFAFGAVLEVSWADDLMYPVFKVAACVGKRRYAIFEEILASDFTEYEPMDRVLVMAYNGFLFDCPGTAGPTGCAPKISDELRDAGVNIDWRSAYRIVPLCARRIGKWQNGKITAA